MGYASFHELFPENFEAMPKIKVDCMGLRM
jgi:hypothetical protein